MNGELSVVSSPSAVTIVRLTIPVRLTPLEERASDAGAGNSASGPLRLLVAEDSDNGYFVFQGYTKGEGHMLTRALDGAQAVEMAKTGEYDLIVMDATMPVMNGYTATQAIRAWESSTGRSQRIPIVLFSADDRSKQVKLGGAAGCSGFLAKPATKAEVLRALKFFAPCPASPKTNAKA